MSDKMRWRYGETNPVLGAVSSSLQVEIGDLVYYDSDNVKPASAQANQSSKSGNQTLFAGKFLGVAMQSSPVGETGEIRIATSGVFEFDCNANTFILGNLVGLEELPGRMGIEDQKVDIVTATANAIGRVVKREPVSTQSVLVAIRSKIIHGAL